MRSLDGISSVAFSRRVRVGADGSDAAMPALHIGRPERRQAPRGACRVLQACGNRRGLAYITFVNVFAVTCGNETTVPPIGICRVMVWVYCSCV